MKKRILVWLMVAVMLMQSVPLSAMADDLPPEAADMPMITVADVTGAIGETVAVTVSLAHNPGIVSMALTVTYDDSLLTLTDVVDSGILPGQMHKPERYSPYTLAWANDTATSNYTVNGVVVTLYFEINDTAEVGDRSDVAVSYLPGNYEIFNKDAVEVAFGVESGSVTVGARLPNYTPASDFLFSEPDAETGTVAILDYLGSDTVVNIAPMYEIEGEMYTVTAITGYTVRTNHGTPKNPKWQDDPYGAFMYNGDIESVTIPETVERIGDTDSEFYAFYGCTALREYKIYGDPVIADGTVGICYDEAAEVEVPVDGAEIFCRVANAGAGSNLFRYAEACGFTLKCLDIAHKGCQLSTDFETAEAFGIRFAAVVDSLNYSYVGYTVRVTDPPKTFESKTREVYGQLMAENENGDRYVAVTAARYGGQQLSTLVIKGIPKPAENSSYTFVVTPYVLTLGEEPQRYDGQTWTVTVTADGTVTQTKGGD